MPHPSHGRTSSRELPSGAPGLMYVQLVCGGTVAGSATSQGVMRRGEALYCIEQYCMIQCRMHVLQRDHGTLRRIATTGKAQEHTGLRLVCHGHTRAYPGTLVLWCIFWYAEGIPGYAPNHASLRCTVPYMMDGAEEAFQLLLCATLRCAVQFRT